MSEEQVLDFTLDHFLVIVAKDTLESAYGNTYLQNWPENNYWAMVSTLKMTVKDDQIIPLMKKYNIAELSDYPPPTEE